MKRRFELLLTDDSFKAHEIDELVSDKTDYVVEIDISDMNHFKEKRCKLHLYHKGELAPLNINGWKFNGEAQGILGFYNTGDNVRLFAEFHSPLNETSNIFAQVNNTYEPYILAELLVNRFILATICKSEKQFKDVISVIEDGVSVTFEGELSMYANKFLSFTKVLDNLKSTNSIKFEAWVYSKYIEKMKIFLESLTLLKFK